MPDLIRPLKQGGTSDAWECVWKGGRAVAKFGPSVAREAAILQKALPGLPELFAWQKAGNPMQSVMIREFIPGMSLDEVVLTRSIDFKLLLSGLAALMMSLSDSDTGLPFVHGDISPDNIIVNGRDVRLVDFENSGWGMLVPVSGLKPRFAAPEVIAFKECSVVGDIFALGRTLEYCDARLPRGLLTRMTGENPAKRPQSWNELI